MVMEVPTKPGKISEYSARPIHGRSVGRFKEDGGIAPLARCSADHPLRRGLREHRIVSVIDSPRPPRYCPVSVRPARYLEDQHARDPCPHESPLAGMDVGRGVRANGLTCPKSEECLSSRV